MSDPAGPGTGAPGGEPTGIDVDGVTAWFARHVPDATAPLSFSRLAGGRSNLTYVVTDAAGLRWVLRRPPLGAVLATAHDMGREARILSGLAGTAVPVPAIAGVCDDPTVTGAPFYVMAHLDGVVCRNPAEVRARLPVAARRRAGEEIADTLAALHAVEPDDVGLGELGRRTGYIERQLRRWRGQWERDRVRDLDLIGRTCDLLAARIPPQLRSGIVHGDYKLDNCMLDSDGRLIGVLDWEICTLGDPLADLGVLLVYWSEPGDEITALDTPPTSEPGFPTRQEMRERYLSASGADVTDISFYEAFAWWKLACIVEGVYVRTSRGALGDSDRSPESFAEQAERLATRAHDLAAGLGS